jgi:hypothetical protein
MTIEADKVIININFGRTYQPDPNRFGSISASVNLTMEYPGDSAPDEIEGQAASLFFEAKRQVFEQLGLSYGDNGEGILMETFEDAKVVEKKAAPKPATKSKSTLKPVEPDEDEDEDDDDEDEAPAKPVRKAAPKRAEDDELTTDELWEHLAENPELWIDQRKTKTGKQPDFVSTTIKQASNPKYFVGLWAERMPDDLDLPRASAFAKPQPRR